MDRHQDLASDRGVCHWLSWMVSSRTASAPCSEREEVATRRVSQAIKRAQAGDREAIGFIYARYADNVHGYVRSIVHDAYEAENATHQEIGKYEQRHVPFFAWVLRVARNSALDHLRRQRAIPVEDVWTTTRSCGD